MCTQVRQLHVPNKPIRRYKNRQNCPMALQDAVAGHLSGMRARVVVPRSIHGLVTQRLLVMEYIDGVPLMQLKDKVNLQ